MKHVTTRSLLFIFAFSILGFLTSCDKDDEETEVEPSRTELLTADTWRGDKILVNGLETDSPILLALIPNIGVYVPDAKSIILTFNEDGTYTGQYTQGGQTIPANGEWEFTDNEEKISGNFFGLTSEADVKDLTTSKLTLTTSTMYQGNSFPVEIQLVR